MSYRICETLGTEKQAMRDVYCQTMIDLANQNDRIVVMDADLMNSVGTVPFGEAHPERTVNCGIQEANMIGVAAGMSAVGMVPYCHTFGCFATRRCLDQIFAGRNCCWSLHGWTRKGSHIQQTPSSMAVWR